MTRPDALDPDELAAWRGFLRAHAEVTGALDEELRAAHDLPLSSYDVLVQLEDAPGRRLRMRELAQAVLLSRSGLTRLVDRMARQGLVAREPCPDDARGAFAVLTLRGAAALRRARPTHLDGVRRRFLAPLAAGERRALAGAWERVLGGEASRSPS